jgi:hypothetical protein
MGCNWRVFFDFIIEEKIWFKIKSMAFQNIILKNNWWNNWIIRLFNQSFYYIVIWLKLKKNSWLYIMDWKLYECRKQNKGIGWWILAGCTFKNCINKGHWWKFTFKINLLKNNRRRCIVYWIQIIINWHIWMSKISYWRY